MAFDFDGFEESYSYEGEEEIIGLQKLKSMSEEQINGIYETLDSTINEEWEIWAKEFIETEMDCNVSTDAYFKRFNKQYIEEYPNEKKRWDEKHEYDRDLFIDFLKKHNQYDYYIDDLYSGAIDFLDYNGYEEQIRESAIKKASENIGLPYVILDDLLCYREENYNMEGDENDDC
jgi:hypothetical protein